jgi:hypothetical protein
MPVQSRYLFAVRMDVQSEREALFNEVYDREHIPNLLKVKGVVSAAPFRAQDFEVLMGGERKRVATAGEPGYLAVYEVDSPEVLTSAAWGDAVERGRWPAEVRPWPYTLNRRHALYRRI